MRDLLKTQYGLDLLKVEKSTVGAGSDTYFADCADGRYVVKYPAQSEINNPELEPRLCEYLNRSGIPACRFVKNGQGGYLSEDESGRKFSVQHFMEGKVYDLNAAPEWFLAESAGMLGRIHTALKEYTGLPIGIGENFFLYMTPERALDSYRSSLEIARERREDEIAGELEYRIDLMRRFPAYSFDLRRLTCQSTHGDYFISQIICGADRINAVIDWTTACVHPVVWEIIRSYVYAAPSCLEGQIDTEEFVLYVKEYQKFAVLKEYDLQCMMRLFYDQIAVCDYYGQYYASEAGNRSIYLHQARFSTKLLHWLEENVETITARLIREGR